jgi:hypothetical protein
MMASIGCFDSWQLIMVTAAAEDTGGALRAALQSGFNPLSVQLHLSLLRALVAGYCPDSMVCQHGNMYNVHAFYTQLLLIALCTAAAAARRP